MVRPSRRCGGLQQNCGVRMKKPNPPAPSTREGGVTLQSRPVANRAMKVEAYSGGVVVTVPQKNPRWAPLLRWLLPLSKERRIELDAIGTWVLELCDGRHTVAQVIDAVGEKHHLSFQEARAAVL